MDSFASRSTLRVGNHDYEIYRLDALDKKGISTQHLPFSLRILLENLLRTEDGGASFTYFGTYTAYSGASIGSELLQTDTFSAFKLSPMNGSASGNKGMALFPKRIGGDYAVIGRQDGENIFFMRSDDPLAWNGGEKIMAPVFPWELVQIGNCGPPIELDVEMGHRVAANHHRDHRSPREEPRM